MMTFRFETLQYLPLLLCLLGFWWIGRSLIPALGFWRGSFALTLRSIIVTLLILALCGIQVGWYSDRISVVYVLDRSDSIPRDVQQTMLKYAVASVKRDRDSGRSDVAGLVIFASEGRIEVPPFEGELPQQLLRSLPEVRTDATNVEEAIDLAIAAMPPETRQRIVLITDGNETTGNARRAGLHATTRGVGLDVIPVVLDTQNDVSLERLDLPNRVTPGQAFSGRIIVSCQTDNEEAVVPGRITVTQSSFGEEKLVLEEAVNVVAGKTVFPFRYQLQTPGAYSFEARFVPDDPSQDLYSQNNRVHHFAIVGGTSRTLLIVRPGEEQAYAPLVDLLREERIEVDVRVSLTAFGSLTDLVGYDSVILANLPRVGGDSDETMEGLSDAQIEMLVQNTQQFGAGLLMIGGPDAFGAGGWVGSKLEAAMPVDFTVKNTQVHAVGALLLVLDVSGSMAGEKLQLSKAAARGAFRSLGPNDYAGLITFSGDSQETIPLQRVEDPARFMPAIGRIGAGGGTVLYPAMELGYARLARIDAMVKHMLILTDGRTVPGPFNELSQKMRSEGITVSTLAIGDDADVPLLQAIASRGGGKFYRVMSPRAIPQVVLRETRRVSRPLIFESQTGLQPLLAFPHAILDGIRDVPPITGLVLTTPKESSLVQNILISPQPTDFQPPILSVWTYGLGHTAVLTTDVGQRWAQSWSQWPERRKLLTQLVRWLKRPDDGNSGSLNVVSRWNDGELSIVANHTDSPELQPDRLALPATIIGPAGQVSSVELRKVAPGRYVGNVASDEPGNYFIRVQSDRDSAPVLTGATIPFGIEHRARETNLPLLESLVSLVPRGGEPGLLGSLNGPFDTALQPMNHFRGGLSSAAALNALWPWLVLGACALFLGDVANRRLVVSFAWLRRRFAKSLPEPAQLERLDRLQQLHAAKAQSISPNLATDSHSPVPRSLTPRGHVDLEATFTREPKSRDVESIGARSPDGVDDESAAYVERLLEAKRRARAARDRRLP